MPFPSIQQPAPAFTEVALLPNKEFKDISLSDFQGTIDIVQQHSDVFIEFKSLILCRQMGCLLLVSIGFYIRVPN